MSAPEPFTVCVPPDKVQLPGAPTVPMSWLENVGMGTAETWAELALSLRALFDETT